MNSTQMLISTYLWLEELDSLHHIKIESQMRIIKERLKMVETKYLDKQRAWIIIT